MIGALDHMTMPNFYLVTYWEYNGRGRQVSVTRKFFHALLFSAKEMLIQSSCSAKANSQFQHSQFQNSQFQHSQFEPWPCCTVNTEQLYPDHLLKIVDRENDSRFGWKIRRFFVGHYTCTFSSINQTLERSF
jgi:hypothetical protein